MMGFTKLDLKNGMPVLLRGGKFRIVFCGYLRGKTTAFPLRNLNDDLTHKYANSCDVVAVWPIPEGSVSFDEMLNPEGEPLWERKEQIKISDSERIILSNIDEKYNWIARDSDGHLYVYDNKPKKGNDYWELSLSANCSRIYVFDHLFEWCRWSDKKPINFRELLEMD